MKKHLKALVISGCVVAVLAGGSVAFAASPNVSNLESAWLDFQIKLNQEMIKNGDITQEEADKTYNELKEQFEASENDVVYQQFTAEFGPVQNLDRGERAKRDEAVGERGAEARPETVNTIRQYAELTNQETLTIREMLEAQNMNIWQLAEQEGNFDALKTAMLAELDEAISRSDSDREIERLSQQRDDVAAMTSADDYQAPENTGGYGRNSGRPDGQPGGKNS